MEKIDILLATYNGEKYIKEQLDSILNQSYKDINIIVSDDKSTDNTLNILKEYEVKDSRIKVYEQEKNLGYIKNFEFLLNKVSNNYFALSDQDDIWKKDKVEKSFNKLIESNADLVFTDLEIVDKELKVIHKSMFEFQKMDKKLKKYIKNKDKISGYLYNFNRATGCTMLGKTQHILKYMPFPSDSKYMPHDYWISLNTSLFGKIEFVNESLILYRQHGTNQIGTDKVANRMNDFDEIRELFLAVKLEKTQILVDNDKNFNDNQKDFNQKSLEYFKRLKQIKYINFKGLNIFHKLYKYENFSYYIKNLIILNFPLIGKVGFRLIKK